MGVRLGAVGFRPLARNLAIGQQIRAAGTRPAGIREPITFCATHGDGPGTLAVERRPSQVQPFIATLVARFRLPWAHRVVGIVA